MDDIGPDEAVWQCPVCNNKLHDTEAGFITCIIAYIITDLAMSNWHKRPARRNVQEVGFDCASGKLEIYTLDFCASCRLCLVLMLVF